MVLGVVPSLLSVVVSGPYLWGRFEVTDGDVVLEVARGTTVRLQLEPSVRGECRRQDAPALSALLRAQGRDALDADTSQNDYDWSEAVVQDGDEVTVVAQIERADGQAGAYRAGLRLRATPATSGAVVVETSATSGAAWTTS
jgi:hypothetical protein